MGWITREWEGWEKSQTSTLIAAQKPFGLFIASLSAVSD